MRVSPGCAYPQDARTCGLTLVIGRVRRAIRPPLLQQVRVATRGEAQVRVQRAQALLPDRRKVVPREAHFAKHGIIGDEPAIMIAQRGPVRRVDRTRGALRRPRLEEHAQQRRSQRHEAPEEREFHRVGRGRACLRAGDVGDQGLKILLNLLYTQVYVGRHRASPLLWWVMLHGMAYRAMAFNVRDPPHGFWSHSLHFAHLAATRWAKRMRTCDDAYSPLSTGACNKQKWYGKRLRWGAYAHQ